MLRSESDEGEGEKQSSPKMEIEPELPDSKVTASPFVAA